MKREEAIEVIKELQPNDRIREALHTLIPELADSEDERIRKWLIEMVEEFRKLNPTNAEHNGNCSEAIAYLEKQKEQIKWPYVEPISEEENLCLMPQEQCSAEMDNEEIELSDFESELFSAFSDGWQQYLHGEEVNVAQWAKEHSAQLLNAAKKEQQPAEWSEEDENAIRFSIDWLSIYRDRHAINQKTKEEISFCIDKLKSLRPKLHWKPSEEQMKFLKRTVNGYDITCRGQVELESLYKGLKKLM